MPLTPESPSGKSSKRTRANSLQPPFNNKKARQALLCMVDQKTYLDAVIGNAKYYRTCPAVFMCGGTDPHKAVDVLNAAFKPKRTVVKEHLRANAMSERTSQAAASKEAPVRLTKARRAA